MKTAIFLILGVAIFFVSCQEKGNSSSIIGTWKLITGTLVEKNKTTVTRYDSGKSFIKIINPTHFAFLQHDLNKGKDSATTVFEAGGGTYTLNGNQYTEHLEYCSGRAWEGNNFTFTVEIKNDTLIQTGTEKIDSLGVDRLNTEKYIRVKQ